VTKTRLTGARGVTRASLVDIASHAVKLDRVPKDCASRDAARAWVQERAGADVAFRLHHIITLLIALPSMAAGGNKKLVDCAAALRAIATEGKTRSAWRFLRAAAGQPLLGDHDAVYTRRGNISRRVHALEKRLSAAIRAFEKARGHADRLEAMLLKPIQVTRRAIFEQCLKLEAPLTGSEKKSIFRLPREPKFWACLMIATGMERPPSRPVEWASALRGWRDTI
jgi:hypothetical protein